MVSNQLHINNGKCVYMYFRPKNTHESSARTRLYNDFLPTLWINDYKIPQVTSTKFLGVLIDDQLSWQNHIDHLENKLKGCLV